MCRCFGMACTIKPMVLGNWSEFCCPPRCMAILLLAFGIGWNSPEMHTAIEIHRKHVLCAWRKRCRRYPFAAKRERERGGGCKARRENRRHKHMVGGRNDVVDTIARRISPTKTRLPNGAPIGVQTTRAKPDCTAQTHKPAALHTQMGPSNPNVLCFLVRSREPRSFI